MSELTRDELAAFREAEAKATADWEVDYSTTAHLPFKYTVSTEQETCEEADANAALIALMRNNWLRLIAAAERGIELQRQTEEAAYEQRTRE